jgi:hypothetical protein
MMTAFKLVVVAAVVLVALFVAVAKTVTVADMAGAPKTQPNVEQVDW